MMKLVQSSESFLIIIILHKIAWQALLWTAFPTGSFCTASEKLLSSKLAGCSIVVASFVSLATTFLCFASKAISRSLRCSSSPNQTHLRLGFDSVLLCPQNWLTLPHRHGSGEPWRVPLYLQRIMQLVAGGFLIFVECVSVDVQRCRDLRVPEET